MKKGQKFAPDNVGREIGLTEISSSTKFVIKNSNGQVLTIFKDSAFNKVLKDALAKYGKDNVKRNRYGDLLIMNN